jgi:hypothetical protein
VIHSTGDAEVKSIQLPEYLKRLFSWLFLVCAVGGAVFFSPPVQRKIEEKMLLLKDYLVSGLEERIACKISYESVSPSLFSAIEIRGLKVWNHDMSGALLDARRLEIHYSLGQLVLGGVDRALREIVLENAVLDIDTRKDEALVRFFSGSREGEGGAAAGGSASADARGGGLGRITGRNISLHVLAGDDEFFADKMFFQARPEGGDYDIRLKSQLSYTGHREAGLLRRAETVMSVRGLVRSSYDSGELTLGLSQLSTNIFDAKRQVFHVSFSPEAFSVRKIQDRAPLDFSLAYTREEGELKLDFFSERFRPSSLVTLKGEFARLNEWLGMSLTSRGSAVYNLAGGELDYSVSFDGSVKNSLVTQTANFSGSAHGTQDRVVFAPLTVAGGYGSAVFTGDLLVDSFYPQGNLSLRGLTLQGPVPLSANLRIERDPRGVSVSGKNISWGGSVYSGLSLRMEKSAKNFIFTGNIGFASGETENSSARVLFLLPRGGKAPREFYVTLKNVPARDMKTPFENFFSGSENFASLAPALTDSSLKMSGAFFGEAGPGTLSVDIPKFSLFREEGREDHRVNLSARYEAKRWEIRQWDLRWDAWRGRGNARGNILDDGALAFAADLSVMDIPYTLAGTFDAEGALHVEGTYGLTLDLARREEGGYAGAFTFTDFPIPGLYDVMRLTARLDFTYAGQDAWQVRTNIVQIENFAPSPHIAAAMSFAAEIEPGKGFVRDFTYKDSVSTLRGGGDVSYGISPLNMYTNFNLSGDEGENYILTLLYENAILSGTLTAVNSPVQRFTKIAAGLAGVSLKFSFADGKPEASLRLDTTALSVQGKPASLSLAGSLKNDALVISTLDAAFTNFRIDNTRLDYSIKNGFFNLSSLVHKDAPDKKGEVITWALYSNITLSGLENQTETAGGEALFTRLLALDIAGGLRFSTNSNLVAPRFRDWNFLVRKEKDSLLVSGGSNESVEGRVLESGEFSLIVKEPFPVTFETEGRFADGILEANINKISFRVEDFSWLFDFGVLQLTAGDASGNLRIFGPAGDPEIYGTVAVHRGYANLVLMPDKLGPWEGNLLFREKEFSLPPMFVPAGSGSAMVSGLFELDHWIPSRFSLTVDTAGSPGVHIVNNFNGVDVNGIAQGIINIEAENRLINIAGDIRGSNVVIAMQDASPRPAQGQKQWYTAVNMWMETGRSVEFNWRIFGMPILQTFANMGEKIHLSFNEETSDFQLQGDIQLRGGEVFWFDRRFFIREGLVRLDERAGSFDPRLTMRAELRENTEDGLVRIYLIADDTRFSQFSPRFESDAGFTNSEILAALGRNVLGTSGEQAINIASTVPYTGDILAQIGIVKTVEKNVRDVLHVDLFSVRTHLVQTLLQGVVTPQEQRQESERRRQDNNTSFGRYLDKTSVFLGKYIGSDMFVNFLLQFRAQDILAREEDVYGGVIVDAEVMLEFKTPFFLLEWSIMPKHPEEMFIFDNTFTFRWRFPL